MYGKVCDWVRGGFCKSVSCIALTVSLLAFNAYEAFAQAANSVQITPPDIDFGAAGDVLIQSLTTAAVVGLGVGLSIWALLMVVRIFRRTAK